jgi:hypothetical protein
LVLLSVWDFEIDAGIGGHRIGSGETVVVSSIIQSLGVRSQSLERLNQTQFLSLAASLFPSRFLGLAVRLDLMVAVGAEDQPGESVFACEGGAGN